MATVIETPKTWRKRLVRFTVTSALMGISFAIGAAVTAFIAIRLLLPIAATGMTMGLAGMASASVSATANSLYTGDSATRLMVLTQLKQSFDAQTPQLIDPQLSPWILPAIEQCKTDSDPAVVDAATELAVHIAENTSPNSQ